MKKPSVKTSRDQIHTPKSPKGSGDYYGQAIKQKVGRIIDVTDMQTVPTKKLGKPPRSLA